MSIKFNTYKYVYGDGTVEYVKLSTEDRSDYRFDREKAQRAVLIKNITNGAVLKDRYGKSPRREQPEVEQCGLLDDDLFEI